MSFATETAVSAEDRPTARAVVGDALTELKKLSSGSVKLLISSPPYNIRKIYERDRHLSLTEYLREQNRIVKQIARVVADNGSVCWQVGTYINNGQVVPLDIPFFSMFSKLGLILRNRIIWQFNFGHNSIRRFSGRYEVLLWFTKSDNYTFNLDPVRIPQKYPGKRHSSRKGASAGKLSGNPRGKNPSDYWEFSAVRDFIESPVWHIPNVKWNHPEKTDHPCQFPIELAERCVLSLTEAADLVVDPYVGTGASIIAAAKHGRSGLGFDRDANFVEQANARLLALRNGTLPIRQLGKPIREPINTERVARMPEEWTASSQGKAVSR